MKRASLKRANARKQVFVAYSYKLYPKDDYRKVFKELEMEYDVSFIFADEKITNMHIMKKIETFIRGSDFSLFDISGWNPNVTLELGYAMPVTDQWYIAIDPSRTEIKEVPSDLRGLDRIEYGSYTELQTKLRVLIEQRYPRRSSSGIDDFLASKRSELLKLLKQHPGLTMKDIAQVLQVQIPVAQIIMTNLLSDDSIATEGKTRGMKYYLLRSGQILRKDSRGKSRLKTRPHNQAL